MLGIDISKWQIGLDFSAVVQQGFKFAIIKASQADFKDPEFESHYYYSKKAGLMVGAYHYCTATTKEEAKKEAKCCIEVIKGKRFEFPIFLDIEDIKNKNLSKSKNDEIIRTFCDELEKAGYWAGFYCNLDFYKNYCNGAELSKRYSLWLASWAKQKPDIDTIQIWQYGGEVNFLRDSSIGNYTVDQDVSYIDYLPLIKAKMLNGYKSEDREEYTIKKGDTLWSLAIKFYGDGKKYSKIAEYNNIVDASRIYEGQKIFIPKE